MTELQKKSLSIVLNQVQEQKMSVDDAMTIIDSLFTNNSITITNNEPSPVIRPYYDKDYIVNPPKFPWDNIIYCADKTNHTPDYPGPTTSTTDKVDYSNVAVKA